MLSQLLWISVCNCPAVPGKQFPVVIQPVCYNSVFHSDPWALRGRGGGGREEGRREEGGRDGEERGRGGRGWIRGGSGQGERRRGEMNSKSENLTIGNLLFPYIIPFLFKQRKLDIFTIQNRELFCVISWWEMLMRLIIASPSYLLSLIYDMIEFRNTIILLSLSTFWPSTIKMNYINISLLCWGRKHGDGFQ